MNPAKYFGAHGFQLRKLHDALKKMEPLRKKAPDLASVLNEQSALDARKRLQFILNELDFMPKTEYDQIMGGNKMSKNAAMTDNKAFLLGFLKFATDNQASRDFIDLMLRKVAAIKDPEGWPKGKGSVSAAALNHLVSQHSSGELKNTKWWHNFVRPFSKEEIAAAEKAVGGKKKKSTKERIKEAGLSPALIKGTKSALGLTKGTGRVANKVPPVNIGRHADLPPAPSKTFNLDDPNSLADISRRAFEPTPASTMMQGIPTLTPRKPMPVATPPVTQQAQQAPPAAWSAALRGMPRGPRFAAA